MNDSKEIPQEQPTRRPVVRRALAPPPPTAPGEFLDAQKLPVRPEPSGGDARPPLTPPPPSAPGEFLALQQRKDAPGPAALMDAFLNAAGPAPQPEYQSGIWPAPWWDEEPPETEAVAEQAPVKPREPVRIRSVSLAPGEEIVQALLPDQGLSATLPSSGQALILTSRRLIAFRGVEGFRDTHLAMASEISQFSIRTGQRNWGAIIQGLLLMAGGGFLYLLVGYWLAGQVSGPNVPVLNIDVAPLIALLIILAGLLVVSQNYFTRPAGAVIFRGPGVEFVFPFRSALDVRQVYDFVDMVQAVAQQPANPPGAEKPAIPPG